MQPKDLLFKALRHEPLEQTPWVPFAGVHAGKLIGVDAEEVLKNPDKLYASLMKVNELYRPNGQPVVFDLQLEAEALGCELLWSKNGPPSVVSHPLEEELSVPCRCTIPTEKDGRIPMVLDVMRRMKASVGETTALYGLICGPFTLASHLRGNDIFMDMFDDDETVKKLLDYCTEVGKRLSQYYIEAGMDVVAVVDPLISQISVAHFEEFMTKPFSELFDFIREKGAYSSFFVCGDATRNIKSMCETSPDGISVDENVNLLEAKKITDTYQVAIAGNIPLTSIMLHGTQQDNMKFVIDLLDSMESKQNFILSPGCDMPYDIPVENTIGAAQAVLEPDAVREMIKNYTAEDDTANVVLPDFPSLPRPLMEVFTLDSSACAACQYMMGVALDAGKEYEGRIDVVEYKYTIKENIARCKKVGVKNLPCIYIDGQLKFSSIIPKRDELNAAIDGAIAARGGTK